MSESANKQTSQEQAAKKVPVPLFYQTKNGRQLPATPQLHQNRVKLELTPVPEAQGKKLKAEMDAAYKERVKARSARLAKEGQADQPVSAPVDTSAAQEAANKIIEDAKAAAATIVSEATAAAKKAVADEVAKANKSK